MKWWYRGLGTVVSYVFIYARSSLIIAEYGSTAGEVANPARGQLNRENELFSVPVRACAFGSARRIRPSRPASAYYFSSVRLNLVLVVGGSKY